MSGRRSGRRFDKFGDFEGEALPSPCPGRLFGQRLLAASGLLHAPAETNLRLRKQIRQRNYCGAHFHMPQVVVEAHGDADDISI